MSLEAKAADKIVVQRVNFSRFLQPTCPICPVPTWQEQGDPKKGIIFNSKQGELYCGRCGGVVGGNLPSEEAEYRVFQDDDGGGDPERVGDAGNILTADQSLSTYMSDAPNGEQDGVRRPRNVVDPKQRALEQSWRKVDDLASKMEINKKVVMDAKAVMKAIHEDTEWKHRKNEELIAAVLYSSSKALLLPLTIKLLVQTTGLKKKQISRAYTRLEKWRKKQVEIKHAAKVRKGAGGAGMQITQSCSKLGIPYKIELRVQQMVKTLTKEAFLEGKDPGTKLGAVITLATQVSGHSGDDIQSKSHLAGDPYECPSVEQIASVVDMAATTVTEAYAQLWNGISKKEVTVPAWVSNKINPQGRNVRLHKWWRVPLIYHAMREAPAGLTVTQEQCLEMKELVLRASADECRCCSPPVAPYPSELRRTSPALEVALANLEALKQQQKAQQTPAKEDKENLQLAQTKVRMAERDLLASPGDEWWVSRSPDSS
eukprot:gb/GEZN01004540.1/.p1 GENE.gb/GEZN01004540.1/~~gb/GEZN01004540.1/.p1  ORF type:complete len:486 (-),score=89.07 gb/GEZN01004540.1/:435-1892(-)